LADDHRNRSHIGEQQDHRQGGSDLIGTAKQLLG
jgi:hypothetical protein